MFSSTKSPSRQRNQSPTTGNDQCNDSQELLQQKKKNVVVEEKWTKTSKLRSPEIQSIVENVSHLFQFSIFQFGDYGIGQLSNTNMCCRTNP